MVHGFRMREMAIKKWDDHDDLRRYGKQMETTCFNHVKSFVIGCYIGISYISFVYVYIYIWYMIDIYIYRYIYIDIYIYIYHISYKYIYIYIWYNRTHCGRWRNPVSPCMVESSFKPINQEGIQHRFQRVIRISPPSTVWPCFHVFTQ